MSPIVLGIIQQQTSSRYFCLLRRSINLVQIGTDIDVCIDIDIDINDAIDKRWEFCKYLDIDIDASLLALDETRQLYVNCALSDISFEEYIYCHNKHKLNL